MGACEELDRFLICHFLASLLPAVCDTTPCALRILFVPSKSFALTDTHFISRDSYKAVLPCVSNLTALTTSAVCDNSEPRGFKPQTVYKDQQRDS